MSTIRRVVYHDLELTFEHGNDRPVYIRHRGDGPELDLAKSLFIDVEDPRIIIAGGGYGLTSVIMSGMFGKRNVFTFEPIPELVGRSSGAMFAGAIQPFIHGALWSVDGDRDFLINDDIWASSHLKNANEDIGPGYRCILVPTYNINEEIRRKDIDCLLLDIEGAEDSVLRAISPAVWKRIRALVVEIHLPPDQGTILITDTIRQYMAGIHVTAPDVHGHVVVGAYSREAGEYARD